MVRVTMGAQESIPSTVRDYYAAFVIDPDGYRIEAVVNRPR